MNSCGEAPERGAKGTAPTPALPSGAAGRLQARPSPVRHRRLLGRPRRPGTGHRPGTPPTPHTRRPAHDAMELHPESPMRHRSRLAGLPWVLLAPDAWAAAWPEVAQLRFEGNRVTREETLRREIALVEGDAADPAAIEAGRQAILDLELFREAEARTGARADGRVDVVYRVHEKRYVLPIPRVNTSSDADLSYGAQLRWINAWGLGHRLDAVFERGDFPEDRRRREEQSASFTYEAPFLVADRYDLRLSAGRLERVTPRGPTGRSRRWT
ncbi:MAG: POTRA domain-containing protein [Pseudomonadota bacterium]